MPEPVNPICPKCGQPMRRGWIPETREYLNPAPLLWLDASVVYLKGSSSPIPLDAAKRPLPPETARRITCNRCTGCGYLEFYASGD